MIYDKYGCNDDAEYEEEQEKLREEIFENYSAEMQERVEEIQDEEKLKEQWETISTMYSVENYFDNIKSWGLLEESDKVEYCKQFLKPIDTDNFPLQRQVFVLTNLVNLNILTSPFYQIMEAVLYDDIVIDELSLHINYLIPKKHYKEYIDRLYQETDTKSLHIPIENSTEYLQELLEIWCLHKQDFNPYEISKALIPYEIGVSYEKKQIERKLTAIRTLLN